MSTTPAEAARATTPFHLSREHRNVFIALMIGMLVASISQTIVGPAMPRIVAELGGMEHYSWVATAAMLVSAVTVPIVGKLADLYGRRPFYLAALGIFMVGSLMAGLANSFGLLVAARAVQGLGMGAIMPLSQTVIGDIIPARQRGKYQGLMGAVFGVTSVAGPLAGGFITDHWGWRWLFFATIPLGLLALIGLVRFLHIPHERRDAKIDYAGMATLTVALTSILLATSFGGTRYAWDSWQILGLYAIGAVFTVAFVLVELRASEPVLPMRLFTSSVFTFSNISAFLLSMVMFGAIIYIPVFAQGVLGVDATNSGLILMPLMLGFIILGIVAGLVITRTGRYKGIMLSGIVVMGGGLYLLTRLGYGSSTTDLTIAMVVLGVGLGLTMQQYTLVVQNNAERRDLGVATASTQFFRNVGSTVGIALCGTVMTSGMAESIEKYLPPDAVKSGGLQHLDAGAVLDPQVLGQLPPAIQEAVRHGLGDQIHNIFIVLLPMVVLIFLATMFIKAVPLRDHTLSAEHSGEELLDSLGSSDAHDWDSVEDDVAGKSDDSEERPRRTMVGSNVG